MSKDARQMALEYYHRQGRDIGTDLRCIQSNQDIVFIWAQDLVLIAYQTYTDGVGYSKQLTPIYGVKPNAWAVHLLIGKVADAKIMANKVTPMKYICFQRGMRNSDDHIVLWNKLITTNRYYE